MSRATGSPSAFAKIILSLVFITVLPFLSVLMTLSEVRAHIPSEVEDELVAVLDPEISKVFFGELNGKPQLYQVISEEPWLLHINLLVPLKANGEGRYDATLSDGETDEILAELKSDSDEWRPFYEEFGADWYVQGPELNREMESGIYEIVVSGNGNRGKYALSIGTQEKFPISEMLNSVVLLPRLKASFFEVSPATFVFSIFGAAYLVLLLSVGFILGFLVRWIVRSAVKADVRERERIGDAGRFLTGFAFVALTAVAIFTTWNVLLLLLAGYALFEAVFAWSIIATFLSRDAGPA